MKEYTILTSFNGSQTGLDFQHFEAGNVAMLSDSLIAALGEGYVKPTEPRKGVAVSAMGETESVETVFINDEPLPENRQTKVTGPEETKPAKPFAKKGKK